MHVASFADAAGAPQKGEIRKIDTRVAYAKRVLSFIDPGQLKPLRIVANAGNGAAGPTFDAIAELMEASGAVLEITRVHQEPDGTFPNGIPNPLLPENHEATASVVREAGADLGVAWDGDFDRCFFFDEKGQFVPGEYIVGVLARAMLEREPGAVIVHDPRVVWNTQRIVGNLGGRAVVSRTGHALVKEKMRKVEAAYGGEMSAHHYFRDFMNCDSGMIPLVLVLDLLSRTGTSLSAEVSEMRERHPSSGEINFRVENWWQRFGPLFAAEIQKRRIEGMKSSRWRWHLDEIFVKINGDRHYLWRAVDHEGEVLESFVTKARDKKAALKFLKKAMRKHGRPEVIVTDRLRSYSAALKEIGSAERQNTGRWLNNRAGNSHLPFRRLERAMLRFRSMQSLQKFASIHASIYNLFNLERSLSSRPNFKLNRAAALAEWRCLGAT